MPRLGVILCLGALILLVTGGAQPRAVRARGIRDRPASDASAVIAAVNSLRSSNGLPPYTTNSILMGIAQAHADYMASTGSISHTGPGGTRPYQRALAAGYPLAGEIPPGFFSENIQGGTGLSAEGVVQIWTGDSAHSNTMLSSSLQEIGAGVAESGGLIYYVIDCGRPTTSGLPQEYTPGEESAFNSSNEIIVPVSISTPDSNGKVIHEVQSGQSLWQIAITYGVKIDQIRGLNQLPTAYVINPGDTLLIKTVDTPTPVPPTAVPRVIDTPSTPAEALATSTVEPTGTATPTPPAAHADPTKAGTAVGAIILVALAAAGLVAWAGRARPV
jgi:uncharacterized protein YkwD